MRILLIVVSIFQGFLAIAFFFQWSFALAWWPFPNTTPLTYQFVSSIFAAAAASTFWAASRSQFAAIAGIGLDYFAIWLPLSVLCLKWGLDDHNSKFTGYGIACILGAVFGLWLLGWSIHQPLDRSVRMPHLVWWSFVVFIVALVIVSTRLLLKIPNTIPWKITSEQSSMIGLMFGGAAVYFTYGVLRPSWSNAAGQLVGFLAYDLVLLGPFLYRLPQVQPEHQTGQVIYLVVVIYSGLLAVYFLFFHPTTRFFLCSAPEASIVRRLNHKRST